MSPELTEAIAQTKSGMRKDENIELIQRAIGAKIIDHDDLAAVSSIQEEAIEHINELLKKKGIGVHHYTDGRLSLLLGKELTPTASHRQALMTIVALLEKMNV